MVTSDVRRVVAELVKLKKSDLIDIILYRRLPSSACNNAVLDTLVKSMSGGLDFVTNSDRSNFNDDPGISDIIEGDKDCANYVMYKREIFLTNKLCDQLESRTNNQDDLISFA